MKQFRNSVHVFMKQVFRACASKYNVLYTVHEDLNENTYQSFTELAITLFTKFKFILHVPWGLHVSQYFFYITSYKVYYTSNKKFLEKTG